jgi:predicted kinase
MAPSLTLTKGLPASGKTTWAKAAVAAARKGTVTRVSRDDLRHMMFSYQFSKGNERAVTLARDDMITQALTSGRSVIVDETGLNPKVEDRMRELAHQHAAEFAIKDFTYVPLAECLARNFERANPVPESVIRRMYEQYLKPEAPTYDESLPRALIVDIDGTLAHMVDRNPFEWDRVGEDTLDPMVAEFVNKWDGHIAVMSGRDGSARQETVEWLARNAVFYDVLYMRAEGDYRKDSIVKRELFDTHVLGKYYPALVLDDRNQVVDMWRNELGLTVWQVAEGNF